MHLGLGNGQTEKRFRKFLTRSSTKFDGTDDLVTTTANETLATQTFSFWLKNSDTSERQTIFTHGLHYRGAFHISWDVSEDHGPIVYFDANSYKIFSDAACPQQDDGNWHHWLISVDSTAIEDSRLWIDNEEITSVVATNSGAAGAFTAGIMFGKSSDRTDMYGGSVDEFAIFTGAQTDSQEDKDFRRSLYNNGQPTKIRTNSNLAHWFRMGDGKLDGKSDGDENLLFDQGPNGGLGSELTIANPYAASGWTTYGNTVSNPSTNSIRVARGASGGSNSALQTSLASGGILTGNVTVGKTYKLTFDFETDETSGNIALAQFYDGSSYTTLQTGSGSVEYYFKAANAGLALGSIELSPNQYVQFSNISFKEVQSAGTINGALIKDESTAESVPKKTQNLPSAGSAKSLSFDGSDDFVDLGASSTFFSTNVNSISMWFKMPDTSGGEERIFVSNSDASASDLRVVVSTSGIISVDIWNGSGLVSTTGGSAIDDDIWHHLVYTTNASAQALYIDGVSVATTTHTRSSRAGSVSATIGAHVASSVYADVDVDEVAIWDTALDGDAVKALYNAGQPTPVTTKTGAYDIYRDNLKAYYPFNDNAEDESGNGHDGTISGATIQTEAPKAIYALPPVANTKSLTFDGTNDHLVTQVDDTLATRYYSFWAKSSTTSRTAVWDHGASAGGVFFFNWGDKPILYNGTGYYIFWNDNPAQDDGEWHHWVLYQKHDDIAASKLWCDGVLQTVSSTSTGDGAGTAFTTGIKIGSQHYPFNGSLDEFSIHEDLDEEAIRALYNRGRPIDISSGNGAYDQSDELLHWWRMGDATNDGTGNLIYDQAGSGNATMTNMDAGSDIQTDTPY